MLEAPTHHYIGTIRIELEKALHHIVRHPLPEHSPLERVELRFEPKQSYTLVMTTDSTSEDPGPEHRYVDFHINLRIPYLDFIEILKRHKGAVKLWVKDMPVELKEAAHAT